MKYLAALLICSVFSLVGIQVVSAQSNTATLKLEMPEYAYRAGETVTIPLKLSTQGQAIDGVQVSGTFEGVPITSPSIEINNDLKFQALAQAVSNQSFSIMLVSADPTQPLALSEETTIATFSFVPEEQGTLQINFDAAESLVARSEDAQNILTPPQSRRIAIADRNAAVTTISEEAVNDEISAPTAGEKPAAPAPNMVLWMVAGVLILGGALGGWYFLVHRRETNAVSSSPVSEQSGSTPDQPTVS